VVSPLSPIRAPSRAASEPNSRPGPTLPTSSSARTNRRPDSTLSSVRPATERCAMSQASIFLIPPTTSRCPFSCSLVVGSTSSRRRSAHFRTRLLFNIELVAVDFFNGYGGGCQLKEASLRLILYLFTNGAYIGIICCAVLSLVNIWHFLCSKFVTDNL
jgi:hypothetical protein